MPRFRVAAVALALAAAACSPTFNWRQVRVEPTRLEAMLPCKPEQGVRRVELAGRPVELSAVGCDTGGATFAILHADLGDPARADAALDQWRRATLLNLKGDAGEARPFVPAGATALPSSRRVSASGVRADGQPVRSEAGYFADGAVVFQAVVYAPEIRREWSEPFFEGLRLR